MSRVIPGCSAPDERWRCRPFLGRGRALQRFGRPASGWMAWSFTVAGILLSLAACGPATVREAADNPASATSVVPAPSPGGVTAEAADLVKGDPANLVLRVSDLPSGFQLGGEDTTAADGYTAIYLRSAAVENQPSSGGELLGVTINLSVHPAVGQAVERFEALGATGTAEMVAEIQGAAAGVTGVEVTPIPAELPQADEATAFRARYVMGAIQVHEYRYRFRVANVVGNLIIAARGGVGTEPVGLPEQALAIAAKQVGRLTGP
jgi:hypothetical protein